MRKENAMWIYIQLSFNENCMKISIKKLTFDLPWNYLQLSEHQPSSLKNEKPTFKIRIPQWAGKFGNWD